MKLTAENYFSLENNMKYMGSSQFKAFQKCEAAALAELKGEIVRPKSTALLVGSYVDAHFSNELDLFTAQNPEIFKRDGTLKAEYLKANYIIERIERDELFMDELSGDKQAIMVGAINGVPFKIKVDSLKPDSTNDLKVMRDCCDIWKDGEKQPFWRAWGYDIQAAIYREVRSQNDGQVKPFRLDVVTKETEPDLQIFEFSDDTLEEAYKVVYNLAPRFQAIKIGEIEPIRCGECDYCRMTKTLKVEDIKYI